MPLSFAQSRMSSTESASVTTNQLSYSDNRISLQKKPSTPLVLSKTDTLKLNFQIVKKENDEGVQPHQTFLRFYDEKTNEEGIQPIRVSISGKAKFELVSLSLRSRIDPSLTHPW